MLFWTIGHSSENMLLRFSSYLALICVLIAPSHSFAGNVAEGIFSKKESVTSTQIYKELYEAHKQRDEEFQRIRNQMSEMQRNLLAWKVLDQSIGLDPEVVSQFSAFEEKLNLVEQELKELEQKADPKLEDLEKVPQSLPLLREHSRALNIEIGALLEAHRNIWSSFDMMNMRMPLPDTPAREAILKKIQTRSLVHAYVTERFTTVKEARKTMLALGDEIQEELAKLSAEARTDQLPPKLQKQIVRMLVLHLKLKQNEKPFEFTDLAKIYLGSAVFTAGTGLFFGLLTLGGHGDFLHGFVGMGCGAVLLTGSVSCFETVRYSVLKLLKFHRNSKLGVSASTQSLCQLLLAGHQPKQLKNFDAIDENAAGATGEASGPQKEKNKLK